MARRPRRLYRLLLLRAFMKYAFFKLHMPFGLQKRRDGKWVVFNRFFAPLGVASKEEKPGIMMAEDGAGQQASATYSLTEKAVLKIVGETNVERNKKGEIERFYLFDKDVLPPKTGKAWQHYVSKLAALTRLSEN